MSARAKTSVRARRAWLTGSVLVLIGACSGDVLTLGRAPDVLTPSEAGPDTSVPDTSIDMDVPEAGADADADADTGSDVFIEAGPPPTFGDPTAVPVINDADTGESTDNPTLTRDMTQIYFSSTRTTGDAGPEGSNIWVATRATSTGPFNEPVLLDGGINTDAEEMSPAIDEDGVTLWFGRRADPMADEEDPPGIDIYVSTRATRNDPWGMPTLVAGPLNSDMNDIPRPPALVDGQLVMPLGSRRGAVEYQNYFATQIGSSWRAPDLVAELNFNSAVIENVDGFLRANGMEFYYASDKDGDQDLYFVGASNTGPNVHERFRLADVHPLNISTCVDDGIICKDPWVSEDGEWLYFTSVNDGRDQIYFAQRQP